MHEELGIARAVIGGAAAEKAAGVRRDMLLKLYGRVLEAPNMTLRDTFTCILDALYKARARGGAAGGCRGTAGGCGGLRGL